MRKEIPMPGNENYPKIESIAKPKEGEPVILGNVFYGETHLNFTLKSFDLLQIVEIIGAREVRVKKFLSDRTFIVETCYLYRYEDYLEWAKEVRVMETKKIEEESKLQKTMLDLLTSILEKQGFKILTNEEAAILGLK